VTAGCVAQQQILALHTDVSTRDQLSTRAPGLLLGCRQTCGEAPADRQEPTGQLTHSTSSMSSMSTWTSANGANASGGSASICGWAWSSVVTRYAGDASPSSAVLVDSASGQAGSSRSSRIRMI